MHALEEIRTRDLIRRVTSACEPLIFSLQYLYGTSVVRVPEEILPCQKVDPSESNEGSKGLFALRPQFRQKNPLFFCRVLLEHGPVTIDFFPQFGSSS